MSQKCQYSSKLQCKNFMTSKSQTTRIFTQIFLVLISTVILDILKYREEKLSFESSIISSHASHCSTAWYNVDLIIISTSLSQDYHCCILFYFKETSKILPTFLRPSSLKQGTVILECLLSQSSLSNIYFQWTILAMCLTLGSYFKFKT